MGKHSPSQTNTTFIRVAKTSHKELLRRSEVNGTTIAQEVEKALGTYDVLLTSCYHRGEVCQYRKNGYCSEDGHPCSEGEECRIYGEGEK